MTADHQLVAIAAVRLLAHPTLRAVMRGSLGLDDAPAPVRERCQELVAEVIACGGPHGRAVRLALGHPARKGHHMTIEPFFFLPDIAADREGSDVAKGSPFRDAHGR